MKRDCRWFFTLLLVLSLSVGMAGAAFAAEGTSVLTVKDLQGDFTVSPGSQASDTDLFPSFKGVMPGDVREQIIEIRNHTEEKKPVHLYISSMSPLIDTADATRQETLTELLSMLTLRVWTGEQLVFDGTAADSAAKPIALGVVPYRDSTELRVELTVPVTVNNQQAEFLSEIEWIFQVEDAGFDSSVSDNPVPQTGDSAPWMLWFVLCTGSLGGLIWLSFRRKANERM